jgi:deoxycytidine triphosphate deaminase
MVLSDTEIRQRINDEPDPKQKLLRGYDEHNIKHCGYELRLGKVVSPKTGEIGSFAERSVRFRENFLSGKKCLVLNPSEMVLVITKEVVHLPSNLCATYGQLNRLANQGLMILNTSIVEPGYDGPLSCVLVNFSSQQHALSPDEPIAKVNFHQVHGTPSVLQTKIAPEKYEQAASKNATALPKSLLDVAGVEERVAEKVGSAIRKSVTFGGLVIAILLLWSQLEGVFSNWLYQRTGIMSNATQTQKQNELTLKQIQLDYQKANLELQSKINGLENEVKQVKKK